MEGMQVSDRELIIVQPHDLRDVWPAIREELLSMSPADGVIPEEVYMACAQGSAALCMLHVDGRRVGWMVLRHLTRDFHIWLLWAQNGYDVMAVFRADLMAMARAAGASVLTFGSSRRGWERVAGFHGFKVRSTVYECSIDDLTTEIAAT